MLQLVLLTVWSGRLDAYSTFENADGENVMDNSKGYSSIYQGPNFRQAKHRQAWKSKEYTHVVTFDISRGGFSGRGATDGANSTAEVLGTVKMGLYGYFVPNTVRNFCQLANGFIAGTKPKVILEHTVKSYANSHFHRVIPDFMVQGGDVFYGNGRGAFSIYGHTGFPDEDFMPHSEEGLLSMANSGPNSNGSQFFITLRPTPWLDNKHVVFGKVIYGMDVVKEIEASDTNPANDMPQPNVWITASNCMYVAMK